jgi:cytidylate kinase
MIITIDGPVASGKSSIAKAMAERLGFKHCNTGMLYRAVAYLAPQHEGTGYGWVAGLRYTFDGAQSVVFWQGKQIPKALLYGPGIDSLASKLSVDATLRNFLLPVQRAVAFEYDVIADGRDCGSVVFPHADVKIFLTAAPAVRAKRLMLAQDRHYLEMSLEDIADELAARDERDFKRACAPLVVPEGGVIVDSSDLTFDQTLEACLALI